MEKIICLTGNYPDGQKIDGVRIEYPCALDPASVRADRFIVENRKITEAKSEGNTILLKLDTRDAEAAVIPPPERPKDGEKLAPPPQDAPPVQRRPLRVYVAQIGDVYTAEGALLPGSTVFTASTEAEEPIIEDFRQHSFGGLRYSLFKPQREPGKTYPLVVFLHDAHPCGDDPKLTLSQGCGAVSFADPAWQAENPCFVLAPQLPRGVELVNDSFRASKELFMLKGMIDYVADHVNIDKERIYLAGQSMGCEAACELNIQFPDAFAASLLVAGQWDPLRMAERCTAEQFWFFVSEHDVKAYPGMTAVCDAMEEKGAWVSRYRWDGRADADALDGLVEEAMLDDANVRFTVFTGSSVVPDGVEDNPGTNHVCTWPVVFSRMKALKRWLFSCRRG